MRVTTYRKGEKLPDLVQRVFELNTPDAESRMHEMEKRLLEVNPHLVNVDRIPEGTLILVPELKEVRSSAEKLNASGAIDQVVGVLISMLQEAQVAFEASAVEASAEISQSRKAAKGKDIGRLAAEDPALKERMAAMEREHSKRVRATKDFHENRRAALQELDRDLRSVADILEIKLPPAEAIKHKQPPKPAKRGIERKSRTAYHVTYNRDSAQWRVLEQGKSKPLSVHDTKKEAVEWGREIAKSSQPSQIKIHKRDGKIQEERTYGEDPRRLKG